MNALNNSPDVVSRQCRALRLIRCLQGRPGFNASELARKLSVSRRTIYRDLNLIREAGIPVHYDGQLSVYQIGKDFESPLPVQLEPEDLTRLAVGVHLSILNASSPQFEVAMRESLARLLHSYPQEVREPIQRIVMACRVSTPRGGAGRSASSESSSSESSSSESAASVPEDSPQRSAPAPFSGVSRVRPLPFQVSEKVLEEILASIGCQRQLLIEVKTGGRTLSTQFSPYRVEASEDRWRVIGRSTTHQRLQNFGLDEIGYAKRTDVPYRIPKGFRCRVAETSESSCS